MLTTMMIGNKIAEARKKINVSQAQLARRLFISAQAVGKWERGESMPDIITFNRLAEILGVDLNYFSESFQSASTEITPVEPLAAQSAELTSSDATHLPSGNQNLPAGQSGGKAENKLSWDMSRGNWVGADFSGLKNLQEKFSSSNMKSCKFVGSEMSGLLLKSNNVDSCDFSGSDISSSNIQSSNMQRCLFIGSEMSELLLKRNNVDSCDFSGSDISNCHIQNSSFVNDLFKDCLLKKAEFSGSYIMGCDFSRADFTGAAFKSGGIRKNIMANARLNHTSFNAMQITDIIFDGTLDDCYFENCDFKKVTFRNSTLINTFFKNNGLKGIRFIDCQTDRMTYEFLKNGKADLTGIMIVTQ
jgi:uncharacterized protein YjbI with pentapeptide repeats